MATMQILTMVKKGARSIVLAIFGMAATIGITYFYLLATTANKWHCIANSVYSIIASNGNSCCTTSPRVVFANGLSYLQLVWHCSQFMALLQPPMALHQHVFYFNNVCLETVTTML